MGSPAKHVTVVGTQGASGALQIQPPILSGQVTGQQYVPVSMVEPNGRQMLLTVKMHFCTFEGLDHLGPTIFSN